MEYVTGIFFLFLLLNQFRRVTDLPLVCARNIDDYEKFKSKQRSQLLTLFNVDKTRLLW